jgi:hypothetical protein
MAKSGKSTKKMSDLPTKKISSSKAGEVRGGATAKPSPTPTPLIKTYPGTTNLKTSSGPA